eukprot:m51a1_g10107 hypothetical protein (695) ;mRNA; r:139174-141930
MKRPPTTHTTYRHLQERFVLWAVHKHTEVVAPEFLAVLLRGKPPGASAQAVTRKDVNRELPVVADKAHPPLTFRAVTAKLLGDYITEQSLDSHGRPKKREPSFSSSSSHKSAVVAMFKDYNYHPSTEFADDMRTFLLVLGRRAAAHTSRLPEMPGKTALLYTLHCELCLVRLRLSSGAEQLLAHAVAVLCFVLMSRIKTVTTIAYSHMRWTEDALAVSYWSSKTDQAGTRSSLYRHVYAAPQSKWHTCPLVALGLYWLVCPAPAGSGFLFAGDAKALYLRIRKLNVSVYESPEARKVLGQNGVLTANRLGTHSARKGATLYAVDRSVPKPAIEARLDHKLSASDTPYFGSGYSPAADQFCGRILSGHDDSQPDFAMLPASFHVSGGDESEELERIMHDCFPTLPVSVKRIAQYALAAVIEHSTALLELLPRGHPLFATPAFSAHTLERLKSWLVPSHTATPRDVMRATGLRTVDVLAARMGHLSEDVGLAQTEVARDVRQLRAEISGEVRQMRAEVSGEQQQQPMRGIASRAGSGPQSTGARDDDGDVVIAAGIDPAHEVPNFDVRRMWLLWCCGSGVWERPLRTVASSSLRTRAARKRLSELRSLFRVLEERAQDLCPTPEGTARQVDIGSLSPAQADDLLYSVRSGLGLALTTPRGMQRDVLRLQWRSVATTAARERWAREDSPRPLAHTRP